VAEAVEAFIAKKKRELLDKPVIAKDIGRAGRLFWIREAVTMRPQSNQPTKAFMIERLRLDRIEGARLRGTVPRSATWSTGSPTTPSRARTNGGGASSRSSSPKRTSGRLLSRRKRKGLSSHNVRAPPKAPIRADISLAMDGLVR
jgi:hypothetical protein